MRKLRGRRLSLGLLAAVTLWACGTFEVSPAPPAVAQRHACGNLNPDTCAAVIARVIRQVPEMAHSPIAVTATLDPNRPSQRGGDLTVLVAFSQLLTTHGRFLR